MDWFSLHLVSEIPHNGVAVLDCRHSPLLVILAGLVACTAGYAAFTMIERVAVTPGLQARRGWTLLSALCLGGGIWSTHFVAMLAFQPPVPVSYDLPTTILSLLLVVALSWVAVILISRPLLLPRDYLLGALVMGSGIGVMHYTGSLALRSAATPYYHPGLLTLSFLLAVAGCLAAIILMVQQRQRNEFRRLPFKHLASLALGAAIVALHFTGMKAMVLVAPPGTPLLAPGNSSSLMLGAAIGFIALLIAFAVQGASYADRKLQSKDQDLARVNMLLGQLDRAHDSLQQLANYDHLTNLYNRRAFNEQFSKRLKEHEGKRQSFALLFLDMDHFKRVNDTLGHDAGDELLKIVARRIRSVLRSHDLIARFGGDEFCILSPLTERTEAEAVAQRLMQKMKEPIAVGGRTVVMTASIGICLYPEDGQAAEELLKNADLALHQAKGSGRNTLHLFSSHLKQRASMELQIEEDLRTAIITDALCLYYQPVLDFKTGRIVKLEALIRWQHPQHGLLTPDRFVGIAEFNGFVDQLDGWALRRACRELRDLHGNGFPSLKVAVNCSALNLGHENLPHGLEETLRQEGLAPAFVELEVTENALMANIGKAAAILTRVRDLGMGLSIDDFGTGYSSLAYLKSLPIHTLKVDRSFIKDIPADSNDMEITAAIIAMAHKLNLRVIAEGAETQDQIRFLQENGCDLVQGYFISKPLPMAELKPFLRQFKVNWGLEPVGVAPA